MAIVETLEVRFRANTAALTAGITKVIAQLSALSAGAAAAERTAGNLTESGAGGMGALAAATKTAAARQTALTGRLKGTARALRQVAQSAGQASEGIGLHRLDEIHLVGSEAAKSSGGGSGGSGGGSGGSGGGSGSSGAAKDAREVFSRVTTGLASIPRITWKVCKNLTGGFKKAYKDIDRSTGGLLEGVAKGAAGAAGSFWTKFSENLRSGRTTLTGEGRSLAETAAAALRGSTAPGRAGTELVGNVASAILSGAQRIRSAAASAAAAADFAGQGAQSAAYSAGANLSAGFANGISSKISAIRTSVASAVSAAVSRMKALLKIASPSRVTYALGGYFGEGFANGIAATSALAERSAAALSAGAASACATHAAVEKSDLTGRIQSAVSEALGGTNITVPLEIDGMKLGEAAIRGINRVTRSAGRIMLDL